MCRQSLLRIRAQKACILGNNDLSGDLTESQSGECDRVLQPGLSVQYYSRILGADRRYLVLGPLRRWWHIFYKSTYSYLREYD